jgi:hypothetical protein
MRLLTVLLVALPALAAASCGSRTDPRLAAALGPGAAAWEEHGDDAQRAYDGGRWEDAARALEAQIAAVPSPVPGGGAGLAIDRAVRFSFYNLACARARLGRHEAAFDALDQATRDGAGDIGFDHFVRDPDLASLFGKARWEALVRRLSWSDEVRVDLPPEGAASGGAIVVVLGTGGGDPFPMAGVLATVAVPEAPYAVVAGVRSWTTVLERGERAAEKAVFALARAEEAAGGKASRRILAARGAEAVAVAWEVILRRPGAFTHAVLDGPAPAARVLLDRGGERAGTRVLAAGPAAMPPAGVGVAAEDAGTASEALRRALP